MSDSGLSLESALGKLKSISYIAISPFLLFLKSILFAGMNEENKV